MICCRFLVGLFKVSLIQSIFDSSAGGYIFAFVFLMGIIGYIVTSFAQRYWIIGILSITEDEIIIDLGEEEIYNINDLKDLKITISEYERLEAVATFFPMKYHGINNYIKFKHNNNVIKLEFHIPDKRHIAKIIDLVDKWNENNEVCEFLKYC